MAKFRFRLATLLKVREADRDQLRAKLAEAYEAEQLLETQRAALRTELVQLQIATRQLLTHSRPDMNRLLESQRYQAVLKARQKTLVEQADVLAAEVERRREAVVEADQQVRVLEKLRDRQLDDHRQQLTRIEVRDLDEVAGQRAEVRKPWAL